MISKVVIGSDARGCCKYVVEDEKRAEVIEIQGIRDYNYKSMAEDFEINQLQRPELQRHVFHGILSFPKTENPNNEELKKYALEYLKELKLDNSPYAIVRHMDTEHSHVHIISSLIDLNGNKVDDSWIGLRGKKAAQRITGKYGLTPATQKNIGKMNLAALNDREQSKFKTYLIIESALKRSGSVDELKSELSKNGVEMLFKYKRGDPNEIQGVSFAIGDYKFKGSEVDRRFSYLNLHKHFQQAPEKGRESTVRISPAISTKNEQSNSKSANSKFSHENITPDIRGINAGNQYQEDEKRKQRKRKRPRF